MRHMVGILAVVLFVVVGAGCAPSVRYSSEEIKSYPPEVQQRIIKGEVVPGMNPQQVRYAWGSPDSVKMLEPENGKPKEEWIYKGGLGLFKTRLIFIDSKLTYIITSDPGRME